MRRGAQAAADAAGLAAESLAAASGEGPSSAPARPPQPLPSAATAGAAAWGVSLSPWTLVFDDAALEHGFRRHQQAVWNALEKRNLTLNLAAGVINLTTTVFLTGGSLLTPKGARVLLPYMTMAVLHWCLAARWGAWQRYRAIGNLIGELWYSAVCTLSMPTWVLHGSVGDVKTFVRVYVLGSGIFIAFWCRYLTPNFFFVVRWLTPLQFLLQTWLLTAPTCAALEASPFGAATARRLSAALDRAAGAALPSCDVHACEHLMVALQLLAGGSLLYVQWRMERANRLAYLDSRGRSAQRLWPRVPGYMQAVLHSLAYVQLFAVAWVLMQCGAVTR